MWNTLIARRTKAAMLTAIVAAGGTMFASCGVADVRHPVENLRRGGLIQLVDYFHDLAFAATQVR